MRMRLILSIIFYMLAISAVIATEYQFDAGSYTVKFNSSQELVILPPLPYEESGSHASGWDIKIQDNMTHSIASLDIIEEDQIVPLSNELMADLLDNNMATLSGLKSKKSIKLNGVDGLMSEGYNSQIGMSLKLAIAPFNPFYDSFYKRIATKCFILFIGYNLPVYNEIVGSLNITTNQWPNSAFSGENLNAEAWYNKVFALNSQGKYDEAIKTCDEAIRLDPKNAEGFWTLKSYLLISMGRFNESIVAIDEAINIDPENAEYWDTKGDGFYGLRKYDDALNSYNRATELNKSYDEAWYRKGIVLQSLGRNSESQLAYTKAKELGLSDEAAMTNKGEALYMLGRYNESIEACNKAIELNPFLDEAWLGKSIALRALHQDSEADLALANFWKILMQDF